MYKCLEETFDTFYEAVQQYLKWWGNGGGCYSLECQLKDVGDENITKKDWLKQAKELIDGLDYCCAGKGIIRLLNTIDVEIVEI